MIFPCYTYYICVIFIQNTYLTFSYQYSKRNIYPFNSEILNFMNALQINISNTPEALIILGLTHYSRKIYRFVNKFIGLLGICMFFPIYLVFIPLFTLILKRSSYRITKLLNKIDLTKVSEDYKEYLSFFYELQRILENISDKNGDPDLPSKSNSWYIKPLMNELITFHSSLSDFKEKLDHKLFFDFGELGFTEEEINEAKSRLEPFKEDWEDEKDWNSFEVKYNKYTLQS